MKPKLFLGILLICTILYNYFFKYKRRCCYTDDTVVDSNGMH